MVPSGFGQMRRKIIKNSRRRREGVIKESRRRREGVIEESRRRLGAEDQGRRRRIGEVDSIAAAPVYIYTSLDNETDGEIREWKRAICVRLHPSVVAIRDGAFADCVHLNNIELHDGLRDVG